MFTIFRLLLWGVGLWRLALIGALALAWHSARGDEPVSALLEGGGSEVGDRGPETNLPLPRYVSLRSDDINVRRGPGRAYRRDWVYRRRGLPVLIVEEYGDWRRIVDAENSGGWVYHSLVTGARTALVTAPEGVVIREEPSEAAFPVARAETGVVARLKSCERDWCEIEADGLRGWTPKAGIWGVMPDEVFD